MKTLAILGVVLTTVSGCSSRAVFENAQHNNRNKCQRLPPTQYDDCMERARQTYDEYLEAQQISTMSSRRKPT